MNFNLIKFYSNLFKNPKTRLITIILTFCYLIFPIDILPDPIPFLGQIDDGALLFFFVKELFGLAQDRNQIKQTGESEGLEEHEAIDVEFKPKEKNGE